jgi:hypothetical protein
LVSVECDSLNGVERSAQSFVEATEGVKILVFEAEEGEARSFEA